MTLKHGLPAVLAALALAATLPTAACAQAASTKAAPTKTAAKPLFTAAQAAKGKQLYDVQCSLCHGPREFAGAVFKERWFGQPVRNLFVHIRDTMPQDMPGSLTPEQVSAMVAYILDLNKQPAGKTPLPSKVEALDSLQLPPPTSAPAPR